MLKGIVGQGAFQLAVMWALVFHGDAIFGVLPAMEHPGQPSVHYTLVFNTFVWMQLFNQVRPDARSSEPCTPVLGATCLLVHVERL